MEKEIIIGYISRTDNIEFLREIKKPNLFSCCLIVNEQKVPITLLVPCRFPYHLPEFILPNYDHLGFLPHILPLGNICYLEKESIYINIDDPEVVFQASVNQAIQTLIDGLDGRNHQDFREEFNVFWQRNSFLSPLVVRSFIQVGVVLKKIQILRDNKSAILLESEESEDRWRRIFFKKTKPHTKSGLYIPLELDCPIIPPKYDERWGVKRFIDWLKSKISERNWHEIINNLLDKKPTRFEYIILGIPRNTGTTLLVGVHLKPNKDNKHPFLSLNSDWKLSLFNITRFDKDAILSRSGASVNLQDKKVLIIGCGSVGSHLGIMLAKAGLGFLSLVDSDELKYENVHRYAIGFQYCGKKKVEALKEYISKNLLYTKVTSYPGLIEQLLDDTRFNVEQYDLIISATGDPSINFLLCQQKWNTPLIIGWNEPFGIGGHTVISFPGQEGCYKCLFRNGYNIASLAAKEQALPFHKKHLGCGEVFTPYTALDSIKTSELMARMTIEHLNGVIKQPQILSWKGKSTEFLAQNFQLSNRYLQQNQIEMNDRKHDFVNPNCTYCKTSL